jgi:hypothetical protein
MIPKQDKISLHNSLITCSSSWTLWWRRKRNKLLLFKYFQKNSRSMISKNQSFTLNYPNPSLSFLAAENCLMLKKCLNGRGSLRKKASKKEKQQVCLMILHWKLKWQGGARGLKRTYMSSQLCSKNNLGEIRLKMPKTRKN